MPAPLAPGSSIAIVGAGIVGLSAAFVLLERGYRVTLFERDEPGLTGPSFGNAGHVVGSAIEPLGAPGIAVAGIRMLLDPMGPLKIPPAYMPGIMPWLWRFWRASSGAAFRKAEAALSALSLGAVDETEALLNRAGPEAAATFRREACLYLYESEQSYRASYSGWEQREKLGMHSTHVSRDEIRSLEPQLAPIFTNGVLSHDWGIVTDPYATAKALFRALTRETFAYRKAHVDGYLQRDDGIEVITGGTTTRFDAMLVSAGVWSKRFAPQVGDTLPVEAERGYNVTYGGKEKLLERPLVFADRGVVATALEVGLRLGGWTELGGTSLPPNPAHWRAMRAISDAVIPALKGAVGKEWMGHRPSMPDSIPVISRSGRHQRVFYALGHGHYGLSFAAKSARMIGEIIGEGADAKYADYSVQRFRN